MHLPTKPGISHQGTYKPGQSARYPLILLGAISVWWLMMAVNPAFPKDWLLENVLVFVVLGLLVRYYGKLRFSDFSYTMVFMFLSIHAVGAHFTNAEVPNREWLGLPMDGRNHFDRIVHFLYGFLLMPAFIELLHARTEIQGIWRNLLPVALVMAQSNLYELIEWLAVVVFGGPLGQAYLGTQGDVWDAQRDSALAALGAVCGLTVYRIYQRSRGQK